MVIDFKEIPSPAEGADRDLWELFAEEFLSALGFTIECQPGRGADGGRDMLIVEHLEGPCGHHRMRWLVSCKHYAHSAKSIGSKVEENIENRLNRHGADGFCAFYSTLASQDLLDQTDAICKRLNKRHKFFVRSEIERHLTEKHRMKLLFRRYFPISYDKWMQSPENPSRIWADYIPLECQVCGRDLLTAVQSEHESQPGVLVRYSRTRNANLVALADKTTDVWSDVYVACKGDCDKQLGRMPGKKLASWWDVNELCEVEGFLRTWCALLREHDSIPQDVARKLSQYMLCLAQFVMRDPQQPPEGFARYANSIEELLSTAGYPD